MWLHDLKSWEFPLTIFDRLIAAEGSTPNLDMKVSPEFTRPSLSRRSMYCRDLALAQRRLDSRPQSIMGIERLIPRVASLTVDCRGVNISLTKQIWKLSNDNSVRYSVKTAYCCIVAILIMTCVLLYQVYLFLNCMGRAVILV